jgi:hypothetical protein
MFAAAAGCILVWGANFAAAQESYIAQIAKIEGDKISL